MAYGVLFAMCTVNNAPQFILINANQIRSQACSWGVGVGGEGVEEAKKVQKGPIFHTCIGARSTTHKKDTPLQKSWLRAWIRRPVSVYTPPLPLWSSFSVVYPTTATLQKWKFIQRIAFYHVSDSIPIIGKRALDAKGLHTVSYAKIHYL